MSTRSSPASACASGELPALRFLVRQHRQRRDADDGAIDDVAQLVGAQDDVERLIPWHVTKGDVNRPGPVGSITRLSPLISEKVRSTARRSAPWKSRLTGLPV